MKRATKKTFKKAGFTKLSCKYLAKKANGTKTKTRPTKGKIIVYRSKLNNVRFLPKNKRNLTMVRKKRLKYEVF